jgi:cytochrome b561
MLVYATRMEGTPRYTSTAIVLHWLVAALVFGQFTLGWAMQEIAKQPPGPRTEAFNLHKSIGLALLLLMALRALWRARHRPPALPAMPRWQARLAALVHGLLYATLIALPLTGYLGSEFSGYAVKFFGITLPQWAGNDAAAKDLLGIAHLWLTWLLAVTVALHLAGVAKHTFVDRDGLLRRMAWSRRATCAPPAG